MYLTESEAKETVCWRTIANGQYKCLGSECMAWRWTSFVDDEGDVVPAEKDTREVKEWDCKECGGFGRDDDGDVCQHCEGRGTEWEYVKGRCGYCGVAGLPGDLSLKVE